MTATPCVSVVMSTYNHADHVVQAIESVLKQRGVSFEFLIADDGSIDGTAQAVVSVQDPRIRFRRHDTNRGACTVTNELIAQSTGEFVALINSDDAWSDPDKLAFQVDILRDGPALAATFGQPRFMDKRGRPVPRKALAFGHVFDQQNQSQGAWLRHFFEFGNCLCHPSILIRRRCYEELGAYNNNLRQLPDFDMWIRLLKRYPIHVSQRELIDFRILPGKNASSQTATNSVRIMNEHYLVAESFFDGMDAEVLRDGFADLLRHADIPSAVHLDIEKALLYFMPHQTLGGAYKMIGMLKLHHLLASAAHAALLERDYGIDGRWLHEQTGRVNVLRSRARASIAAQGERLRTRIMRMTSLI